MLVIVVGGIPIAMPTVLSVTLALGAFTLAKEGAIVSRMSGEATRSAARAGPARAWAARRTGSTKAISLRVQLRPPALRPAPAVQFCCAPCCARIYAAAVHAALQPWRRWLAWTSCAPTRPAPSPSTS